MNFGCLSRPVCCSTSPRGRTPPTSSAAASSQAGAAGPPWESASVAVACPRTGRGDWAVGVVDGVVLGVPGAQAGRRRLSALHRAANAVVARATDRGRGETGQREFDPAHLLAG